MRFKFPKSWLIRSIFSGAVLWLISGTVESYVNKKKFLNSIFISIPQKLSKISIPDLVFIVAIILVALILYKYHRRFSVLSKSIELSKVEPVVDQNNLIKKNNAYWIPNKEKSQLDGPFCIRCYADNKLIPMLDVRTVYKCPKCDQIIKKRIENLSRYQHFILNHLVSQQEGIDSYNNIKKAYLDNFKDTGPNINTVLNGLKKFDLISESEFACGEFGYVLQHEGMTYLDNA